MAKEHLPVKEYMAAVEETAPLREERHMPYEQVPYGPPTRMDDIDLGILAYKAPDLMTDPLVEPHLRVLDAQENALETYRPNFIAAVEDDRQNVLDEIKERKNEVKRNTSFFQRSGKNFMTAISYVPGIDTLVGMHDINRKARLNSIDRNHQAYLSNPTVVRLESANEVYAKKYGGRNSYAKSYDKSLKSHRKHESKKHVFELESEIFQLKEDIARLNLDITELRNGRSL